MSVEVFMLMFNFAVVTPDGPQDEVFHVYSKHFDTKVECESTLETWTSYIHNSATDKLNEMLKDGYSVKLKSVKCAPAPKNGVHEEAPKDEPSGAGQQGLWVPYDGKRRTVRNKNLQEQGALGSTGRAKLDLEPQGPHNF